MENKNLEFKKFKGMKVDYMCGELSCISEGDKISWYWNPEKYCESYFLYGKTNTREGVELEKEILSVLETDYFYDSVMTVIQNGMNKEFDGEMFSYLYRKLKK